MNNKNLALKAPLSGPVMPLNRVPDPVFSSGTLGEGIAIDPLNDCLHAPCAGLVSHLARTRHALSLRADNGAELLLHVGLDTVQLQGEGFEALVEEGARVIEGQPLLRFDLDRVARGSRSLITVMILTNGDGFQVRPLTTNPVEVGAPLLQLSPEKAEQRPANPAPGEGSAQRQVRGRARVAHHGGLHARPAALLRKTAQGFSSQAELHFAGQVASVDSLVGIMGLGVAEQDEVEVICRGEDSEAALDALLAALASALVAGVAGVLAAYNLTAVSPGYFGAMASLSFLAFAYLGGISSISGAVTAGLFVSGGLGATAMHEWFGVPPAYLLVVAGIGLIVNAILNPEGISKEIRKGLPGKKPGKKEAEPTEQAAPAEESRPLAGQRTS